MAIKIGFTGTRRGMTDEQKEAVAEILARYSDIDEVHHGDCLGADADFAELLPILRGHIEVHPSNIPAMTANTAAYIRHQPLPPLERNRRIVNACNILIACPAGFEEENRSGTWSTCRYCRRVGKRIIIVWPDGVTTEEIGNG